MNATMRYTGSSEISLDGRVLHRRQDIRRIVSLVNKVHTNLHIKLTFMLLSCRHRAYVFCSPRSRVGTVNIQ